MKKIALALVASTVVASAASANIGTGFYGGLDLGYGSTNAKMTGQPNAGGAYGGSTDVGSNAANIGIHAGYGWVSSCLYFGGEVAYTFENSKVNQGLSPTVSGAAAQLKRSGYFNVALRGGYLFTPNTMMYIRLGGNWGKWKATDSGWTQGFTSTNTGTGSSSRLSFAPGIGLETAVHKNVYVRVEYVYDFGPSISATNSASSGAFTKFSTIRNQTGKVGLSYKF